MLLFEFFPIAVALVGGMAAVWLYVVERRARQDPTEPDPRVRPIRRVPLDGQTPEGRGGRRPSMMP